MLDARSLCGSWASCLVYVIAAVISLRLTYAPIFNCNNFYQRFTKVLMTFIKRIYERFF